MKLADALGTGVTSWRDVHAALIPHNEAGKAKTAGFLFEEFAKHFFLTAPEYKSEFKNVWAEAEIPRRVRKRLTLATRDHGVDLLLEDHEGRFHAVQCKFKTNESKILSWTKDRLSSWLAESDEAQGLVMFTNASGIDPQSTRKAAKKDFTLITVGDLVSLSPETIENIARLARGRAQKKVKRFKPRPHQRRAITNVVKGFKTRDRGQLILPCGAGKTLAALWLKERLEAKRTLVLVPSLALLRQIRQEWAAQQKERFPYLCVCSEKDIDKDKRDAIVTHTFEVPGHVTTKADEISAFARKHRELVVYSTYQSLQAVVDAGVKFDLAICDEAHKTATARHNEFALVHDDRLRVEKRLYMTATPRVLSPIAKGKLGEDAFAVIADMSDEETFGPEFHRMGFGEAIDQGILSDYKILVVGVNDRQVHKHIEQRTYLEDASADQVATSLALQKAMKKHGAAHALTFHSNIKRAKAFKDIHGKRVRGTEVEHVNGSMSTNDRLVLLDEFRDAPHAVLTNARCLTEGVDVPAIDCVAFVDPKHSKIDIVQAAGRALRLGGDDKDYGVILIPVFYEVGEDPEEIASTGVFKNVFEVVRAMADQDERLQAEIMNIKFGKGERSVANPHLQIDMGDDERLILTGFETQLKAALMGCIIDRNVSSWEVRFAELMDFKREHAHCNIPIAEGALGKWVNHQRVFRRNDQLSDERIERLNALGFVWDALADAWEQKFQKLEEYREKHGHCSVPHHEADLGWWVNAQRQRRRQERLTADQVERLNKLGFAWGISKEDAWDRRFQELKAYKKKHGHCNVPARSGSLGSWVSEQRKRKEKLSNERIERLDKLDFIWEPREFNERVRWEERYEELKTYRKKHGHCNVSQNHDDRGLLGNWVGTQRNYRRRGKLSSTQIERLNELGFEWDVRADSWERWFQELKAYKKKHGHCKVSRREDEPLGNWVGWQRAFRRKGKLSNERIERLNKLGFAWQIGKHQRA